MAYFTRAHADGVVHAELFFDPQTHTARGIPMRSSSTGCATRMPRRRELGITSELILCFLRHLPEEDAGDARGALPFREQIVGGRPRLRRERQPAAKFERVFARPRAGLHAVAHAGEEGPADVHPRGPRRAQVERIDHGVRCDEDPALVERLAREQSR